MKKINKNHEVLKAIASSGRPSQGAQGLDEADIEIEWQVLNKAYKSYLT